MKKCPKCMTETDGNFCPECGYDMSLVDTRVCPSCGSESNSLFCPNCGTKLQGTANDSKSSEADITVEAGTAEGSSLSADNSNLSNYERVKEAVYGASGTNGVGDTMKKHPVISGGIVALAIIILIAAFSAGGKSSNTADNNTDSYTASEQDEDYDSDSTYSDGSTSYSSTDDGMDLIQGAWYMKGVVTDGEATDVSAYSLGKLIISGDEWDMTISTDETTNTNGTVSLDFKQKLDDGSDYYVYTMKGNGYSGSVKMTYSAADNFIAVSTGPQIDADNCMFFGK